MSTEESSGDKPANTAEETGVHHTATRRLSKEYKFFRSFSAKVENWPMRKAEALWRRMRERKIAGISEGEDTAVLSFLLSAYVVALVLNNREN
ncbi:hypothetical protein HZH68_006129 [Vespula germanica]|uniref:Uncharacterized protein n=1 Tax=Vespula germanica TaxID=30212 RepID=A0A834NAZ7_VESGE|nr:hypothetical protein HZH68_006129 [Vespula germanica]